MRFQMGFMGSPAQATPFALKVAPIVQTGSRSVNVVSQGGEAGDIAIVIGAAYYGDTTGALLASNPSGWTQLFGAATHVIAPTEVAGPFDIMALVVAVKKLNGAEGAANFFTTLGENFIFHTFLYENSLRNMSSGGVVFPDFEDDGLGNATWPFDPTPSTITAGSTSAPTVAGCGYAWIGGATPSQTFTVSGGEDESTLTTSGALRLRSKVRLFTSSPLNVAVDLENGVTLCGYAGFWIQG